MTMDGKQPREGKEPQAAVGEQSLNLREVGRAHIGAEKSANTVVTPVESMEQRSAAKGKAADRNTFPAQDGTDVLTHIERLGQRAGFWRGTLRRGPEVGARCGKSARRVLSGGRPKGRPYRDRSLCAPKSTLGTLFERTRPEHEHAERARARARPRSAARRPLRGASGCNASGFAGG